MPVKLAAMALVALFGALPASASEAPVVSASKLEPAPAQLQASFKKCDDPLFLGPETLSLNNKLHTAGCKVANRLIAKLAQLPAFNRTVFTCPIVVTIDRKDLPAAGIGYVTPSRCDVAGQKIEAALMQALLPTRFDSIDLDIGDSITFIVDVRVAAARGEVPPPSSMFAFLRQDRIDLEAHARLVTFANKDKLASLPPPPPPGGDAGGGGLSMGSGPAIDTTQLAKAWRMQIAQMAVDAIRQNGDLQKQLSKRAWSLTARFLIGGDQRLRAVDIMAATGSAEEQTEAIKLALLTIQKVDPVPGRPEKTSFFGPVTITLNKR